jgi:hypothetical protein
MASTYNSLGYQLMATGENAGSWGTKTNTTLDEIKESFGYITVAMTADRTLTIPNGSTGTYDGRAFIIECTGALGAARVLDIALQAGDPAANIEKPFIVFNNTSTAYSLTFKATGATGFELAQGSTYLCYHNGTDIINTGLIGAATTDTLTNKTLTAPKFADGGFIADAGGDETLVFGEVSTPVNEFKMTNAATGSGPILASLSTSGTDSNIDINLNPAGSGILKSGTAPVKIAGTETIFVPAQAMFGTTTNGADAQAIETTATRPEMKVLDFDASTIEYAQFSIAMPKSWNEGVITFQAFWSPSNTDTGAALIGLQGVSVANDATSDVTFDAAVDVTDNGTGTVEDVLVSPVSANVTVKAAAADTYTYFQVARNATSGSDSFTGDARLLGIKIFYTTDAANDA